VQAHLNQVCASKVALAIEPSLTRPSRLADAPATLDDKPAELVYKNIQVFKGLPSQQLIQVMFFMRGALGVSCNECHVNFRDFEKDDNPKKQIARQMIEMVRALNQKNFAGQNAINCNTCHRGQTKPLAPLSFAAIKSSPAPAVTMTKRAQPLPSVDQIFERYLLATGGRSAHEKLKTGVLTGVMLSSEGWTAPLKIYKTAPDKLLVTFDIGSVYYQAYNGAKGWGQDNEGVHDITGNALALLKRKAAFFQPSILKEQYSSLKLLGTETIDEHGAYAVEGVIPGAGSETLYFEIGSGLLVRITSRTETVLGTLPHQIDLKDYRPADGVKLPFLVDDMAPDFSSLYKINEARYNTPIESGIFDKPIAPLKGFPDY
jgi:hypothetical protein